MDKSLEDVIKREDRTLDKFHSVGLSAVLIGEFGLQLPTLLGIIQYNWFTGHLSDFGISMQLTAYIMQSTKDKNRSLQALAAMLPATIFTLHEFFPINPEEGHFDYQDIGLYWLAASLTYGITKLSSSEKARDFFSKINPLQYFRKGHRIRDLE
jgi:hypothetical protein